MASEQETKYNRLFCSGVVVITRREDPPIQKWRFKKASSKLIYQAIIFKV